MAMITSNKQQIGAGTTDGLVVQPATDSAGNPAKLAFFGGTPAVQQSGGAQAAIARGSACGMVATFASAASPNSVATLSTGESGITVVTGTGNSVTPVSGDAIFVNKPTSQAGVGTGNVRISSAGVVGVTFSNLSAGFLTPTAAQTYGVVAIRGFGSVSTTLTPASVAAATCAEQTFNVSGLRAGELVQVMKPTSQAGLDVVGCRVVSAGVLGVTFMNATAGPLTPTAAEAYRIISLGGMDASSNDVMYQVSATATVAVASSITITNAMAVSNLAVGDFVVGVSKPTWQSGLVVGGAFVSSAGKLCVVFGNTTTTTVTPTASEIYQVATKVANPVAPLVIYSQTLTPASVAANTTAEQSFTVTGVPISTAVWVNKATPVAGLGIAGVRVTGANNIGITFCNPTAVAITPAADTYLIGNFQMPIDVVGNSTIQQAALVQQQTSLLANAMRSAMVAQNLIAGA